MGLRVMWIVLIVFAAVSAPQEPVAALGWLLGGLWVQIVFTIAQRRAERQKRARLLADCDAQHEAWKRGDDHLAFFGHYPIIEKHECDGHCILSCAERTVAA